MTTALPGRAQRLAHAMQLQPTRGDALVVVHAGYRDPGDLIGVYGVNVPRLAHETVTGYLDRLEAHIRVTRCRALPFVGLAQYADDTD